MTLGEVFAILFVATIGVAATVVCARRVTLPERRFVWGSLWAHYAASVFQVLLVYYIVGDGDMSTYLREAERLARFMAADFGRVAPEILKITFQFDAELPYEPPGSSPRTRSMYGITTWLSFFLSDSRWAINLTFGVLTHLSKFALYLVFRDLLPERYRGRIAIATLLLPSSVLWSAALTKEGVAYVGVGWMIWGFWAVVEKKRTARGVLAILIGGIPSALVKPYILFPTLIGFLVWLYTRARPQQVSSASALLRIAQAVTVGAMSLLVVLLLGQAFPRFALDNLVDEAERLQDVGEGQTYGGSQYSLGAQNAGLAGQAAIAPLGLLTALYRPLIVEVNGPLPLLNSLESTALLLISLLIVRRRGWGGAWRIIRGSPVLMFCLVFVVLFGTAVGVSSTNLGTLSRYRMPMLPMYGVLLAVLLPVRQVVRAPVARHRRRLRPVDPRMERRLRREQRLRPPRRGGA